MTTGTLAARLAATTLALTLTGLAVSPATAATTVARASGTALTVGVGGHSAGSGTYSVANDGTRQSSTGNNRPVVSALTGQSVVSAGVLAQDASTSVHDRAGSSAACAGLAGQGSSTVAVGDGDCLTAGRTLSLAAGTLDLSQLRIVDSTVLQGLDRQLQTGLQPVLDQVVPALQGGLQSGLQQLGDPGLFLDLGAVQSRCTAGPTTADGTASLVDVGAHVQVGGRRVDLVSFPAHPAPNTKVATDLGAVATVVEDGLRNQLATALDGSLGPLSAAVDETEVLDNVLANLGSQLAPLDQNLLSGTLNAQTRPAPSAIDVTALDLRVLPAATQLGLQPLSVQVGRSICGPGGVRPSVVRHRTPSAPKPRSAPHVVPTRVTAGLADADRPDRTGDLLAAFGALFLVATGAGLADYRRRLARAGR
jgi:hypothetical protein